MAVLFCLFFRELWSSSGNQGFNFSSKKKKDKKKTKTREKTNGHLLRHFVIFQGNYVKNQLQTSNCLADSFRYSIRAQCCLKVTDAVCSASPAGGQQGTVVIEEWTQV